jgi:putative oxidoreductase
MNFKRFFFAGTGTSSALGDLGLLLIRFGVGVYLLRAHGMMKLPPPQGLVDSLQSMGFAAPEVMAWLAAFAELAGGALLALGLLTRPACLAIITTMGVAAFVAHKDDPFFAMGGASKEPALMYLLAAAGILFTGAGRFSFDYIALGSGKGKKS